MTSNARARFALLVLALVPLAAAAADGIAFITNLKGDITVDGSPRPLLMSELAKGQKLVLGKEAQLSVMYIQSGKEYALRGPGEYAVGEREIASSMGLPPAARETAWRASGDVLVKVSQTAAASIRMRSFAPAKVETKPRLEYPTRGAVASLQPTLRWHAPDPKGAVDLTVVLAGASDAKPLHKARVSGASWRVPARLKPDAEYQWTLTAGGVTLGSASFRTLPPAAQDRIDKRRPAEKAEFTDRLLFAMLLQEVGAAQDAAEHWARLAQERQDLPELASLAR
ncbi:MAG TPA: hypothetical protein PLD37_06155 [Usitatibacteraceae bacterium]|jgi:hypothetical protein|nr:hypothetical protein [Usitatibacteraceae bacterium]